jgi:hypothetical protein
MQPGRTGKLLSRCSPKNYFHIIQYLIDIISKDLRETLLVSGRAVVKRKAEEDSRHAREKAVEEKFINGKAGPLKCPPSHIVEITLNGELLPEEDGNAKGYAFSWGQLLEIEKDGVVTWEIRLEKLHRDFLDMKKTSSELSDRFLDSIGSLNAPDFLLFKRGSLKTSSASIILTDPQKEEAARKYLMSVFARGNGSPMIFLVRSIRRLIKPRGNSK